MCGIVGAIGNLLLPQEKMVEWLLQLDTARGPHSTGILSVEKGTKKTHVAKVIGTPWELFASKKYEDMMKKANGVLLGHNRWATTGAVTARNAHPFTHGHITGVHNGTLRRQNLLDNHKSYEVDSDNIFHDLARNGVAATIPKLDGAYCLIWFDEKLGTLSMIRNHERPMWFTTDVAKTCVFFASESWMLTIAAMKAQVSIVTPMQLPVDTLISLRATATGYEEVEGSGATLRGHIPVYETYTPGGNGWRNNNNNRGPVVWEKVIFEVIGEVNSEYTKSYSYTLGEVMFGPRKGDSVKVYLSMQPEIRKMLMDGTGFFVGEISCSMTEKSLVTNKFSPLHQIIPSSIKAQPLLRIVDKRSKGERKLVANELMTEKRFTQACAKGCACCTDLPEWEKAEEVLFNKGGTEFLCNNCNTSTNRYWFDIDDEAMIG